MKTKMFSNVILLLFLPFISTSCFPPGQRLLRFEIVADGKVVYEGRQGVRDGTPVSKMWDGLGDVRFKPATGGSSDPGQAIENSKTLESVIFIRISHSANLLASLTLEKLTLTFDAKEQCWMISADDLKQIQRLLKKNNE